jgi:hypothetical protein
MKVRRKFHTARSMAQLRSLVHGVETRRGLSPINPAYEQPSVSLFLATFQAELQRHEIVIKGRASMYKKAEIASGEHR